LYQIAHILEAAGVIQRSIIPGQLTITHKFFAPIDLQNPQPDGGGRSPFAIDSILNHFNPADDQVLQKRHSDFLAEFDRAKLAHLAESVGRKSGAG
jgi:hypothetical protein